MPDRCMENCNPVPSGLTGRFLLHLDNKEAQDRPLKYADVDLWDKVL